MPLKRMIVSTQVVIQRERKRFVNGNQMRKWDTAGHEKRESLRTDKIDTPFCCKPVRMDGLECQHLESGRQ